jgi:hypothetical protein
MTEIIEGNKLIAEFMGAKTLPYLPFDLKECKYHSSWDWLMPVWKKLGNLMYEIRRQVSVEDYNRAGIITINVLKAFQKADIDSAFNWIIEGIKWYNQNAS